MMSFDSQLALKLAYLIKNFESVADNKADIKCECYIYCKDTLKDTVAKKKPIGYIASEDNNQNKDYYIIFRGALWDEAILGPMLLAKFALPARLPGWGLVLQKFLLAYQGLYFVPQKPSIFPYPPPPPPPPKPQPERTLDGLISYINGLSGTLYFAGHSLGGALCALLLTQITNPNILMYNFGCPQVGDSDFTNKYNDTFVKTNPRSFRVANMVDQAIKFPYVEKNTCEYVHIGSEVPFTLDKHDSSKNHEMSTYIEMLEKMS